VAASGVALPLLALPRRAHVAQRPVQPGPGPRRGEAGHGRLHRHRHGQPRLQAHVEAHGERLVHQAAQPGAELQPLLGGDKDGQRLSAHGPGGQVQQRSRGLVGVAHHALGVRHQHGVRRAVEHGAVPVAGRLGRQPRVFQLPLLAAQLLFGDPQLLDRRLQLFDELHGQRVAGCRSRDGGTQLLQARQQLRCEIPAQSIVVHGDSR
jgi:hypothetical protein